MSSNSLDKLNPRIQDAVIYLYELGYGRDSIGIILRGLTRARDVSLVLKTRGLKRSPAETLELRRRNNIQPNTGYIGVLRDVKLKFPGLFT